jgi:peptidyl-prolyl cis-trans isomerase B (cyclophilin B)
MNKNFKRVLAVEIAVAAIVIIGLLAAQNNKPSASPTPSATPTASQESNLVADCVSAISAKSSNEQWDSAPALDLKDKRNFWNLETNCGQVLIEVYPNKAPITVNNLRFLTDENYYNETPCHRLTASSFFVIQCGDPLGSGLGNAGYNIIEENLPKAGTNNYPAGTVAIAKGAQPNTSGAQFFLVYQDTTLGPDYTIVGKIIKGLDVVKKIADAGIVGDVKDGKPKQNFGIVSAEFSVNKPKN